MAIERISIEAFLQRAAGKPLFDVRSPGEYLHAYLPGAVSLPLFTDEERKEVGTAYKQVSREQAIKIGLDYFGPKMRPVVEEVERITHEAGTREVFLYCWRGGMRSGAVAWLLDLYGFKVRVLAGGYKSFRNWVLQVFERPYRFHILGGFTGSGKTEALQVLREQGQRVVDLEGIACHKGSAFGNLGMPAQPGQELFENLLALELDRQTTNDGPQTTEESPAQLSRRCAAGAYTAQLTVWLEDESQRIGNLNIPIALWKTMRLSPVFFLEIPFEARLDHITTEYGPLDRERLKNGVERISKRLGGLEAKNTLEHLETGNTKEAFRILLRYYDKFYLKGLHNREGLEALLTRVPCDSVSATTNAQTVLTAARMPVQP